MRMINQVLLVIMEIQKKNIKRIIKKAQFFWKMIVSRRMKKESRRQPVTNSTRRLRMERTWAVRKAFLLCQRWATPYFQIHQMVFKSVSSLSTIETGLGIFCVENSKTEGDGFG